MLRVFDKTDHKMISLYVRGNSSKTYAVITENVNVEISSITDEGKHFIVESQTTIEILNRCLSQSLLLYRLQIFSKSYRFGCLHGAYTIEFVLS